MIRELRVNNLAIIKEVDMNFDKSFIALTGETGAGKSIILDGISLLLGKRANVKDIMKGENTLKVQGVIEISDNLKSKISNIVDDINLDDNELIIDRYVFNDGKSKISINGKRITLGVLNEIMELTIDILGQHDNQYLLKKVYHAQLLDAFIDTKKYELDKLVKKIKDINKKINEFEIEAQNILEKKDLYKHNINEIESQNLYEGLDDELEENYKIAFNSGAIIEALSELDIEISNNILPSIKRCNKKLLNILEFSNISYLNSRIEEVREILNDIQMEIEIPSEDYDIEELNEKINGINKLKLKYASTIKEILEYKDDLINKLEKLEYSDETLNELKQEKEKYLKEYFKKAELLSNDRKSMAKNLENEINKELQDLNMKDAMFKVDFERYDNISEKGIDDIEFMIKTNAGQDYSKLAKIASGGEISRIMLALKIVFSRVDNLETIIFDEIDAGISGQTVKLVAEKMKLLSKNVQVICVTHSPNIAAKASEQFLIYKENANNKTITKMKKLNHDERINEIARIIAGNEKTKGLIEHVKEMLEDE